jgi:hypothetical protein
LVWLFVVLAAFFGTAWWAGHRIGIDLSSINTFATMFGLTQTDRPARGYEPGAIAPAGPARVVTQPDQPTAVSAPYCNPGQSPAFVHGFADLQSQLGETMGKPVECEHAVSSGGDTVQTTSTGLAAYRKATNVVTFTDGWRHWALTDQGLVQWEGSDPDPPG